MARILCPSCKTHTGEHDGEYCLRCRIEKLKAKNETLHLDVKRLEERLRGIAMTCDYIWQQGPPSEMRGPLEQIETFLEKKSADDCAEAERMREALR